MSFKIENKKDFEEFASRITREEFIRDYIKLDNRSADYSFIKDRKVIDCPYMLGLTSNENCNDEFNCTICWRDSVKSIYFKDNIEKSSLNKTNTNDISKEDSITYDYTREYTLSEVLSFPVGVKFLDVWAFKNYTVKEIATKNNGLWINDSSEFAPICSGYIKAKFKLIPVEREVTFQEILESSEKCRIEHKLFEFKTYDYLQSILSYMCKYYNNQEIKDILKNSKWYIGGDK